MTNTSENTQIKTKNDEIDRANSHTRNLKLINNLILLLIILGVGTLVYFINFEGQKITEIENVTPIPIEKDTSMAENTVEIKNSIISGIDGQNQYYEISTERTWNSIDNKDIVEMSGIKTKLLLKNDLEIKLDVKIDLIENLGFEKIIYARLSENQIIIKSSEDLSNKPLTISFSKDKVLFFDKNRNRIR